MGHGRSNDLERASTPIMKICSYAAYFFKRKLSMCGGFGVLVLDVWWSWTVWVCGGLDLVVWCFFLLGGFGYMAPGFLVWICGGCLRKNWMCGGVGVPVLDVWW